VVKLTRAVVVPTTGLDVGDGDAEVVTVSGGSVLFSPDPPDESVVVLLKSDVVAC
jgi:hypothetical protein